MKRLVIIFIFLCGILSAQDKPRLIITTDIGGDPDDSQSLVRLLLYANEFYVEGLIASASGTPGELDEAVTRPDLINERIEAYGQVLDNLRLHDPNYPSKESLLAVVKSGNRFRGYGYIGEGYDTDGSNHIISVVDKDDPRPVNIAIWGGQTDLAQALWNVKSNRSADDYEKFVAKIRVYDIADQDGLAEYLRPVHPNMFYVLNKAYPGEDSRTAVFRGMYLGGDLSLTSKEWIQQYVSQNHGPLGELYPDEGLWTDPNPHGSMKEGDTPSWFYFILNGLNSADNPDWGGWGGRFDKKDENYYRDAVDSYNGETDSPTTVSRWRSVFQNDFAARMDWCVKNYNDANHAPVISLNGSDSPEPLYFEATANSWIDLDASATTDPDNDDYWYEWWIYADASTYKGAFNIIDKNRNKISVQVPTDIANKSIHLILAVKDNGQPALTSYRRVVIQGRKYSYYLQKNPNTQPTIDGVAEGLWNDTATKNIARVVEGEYNPTSFTATWKALWDTDNLYFFIKIKDDAVVEANSGSSLLQDDAVQLLLDVQNDKSESMQINDYRYVFRYSDANVYELNSNAFVNVRFSYKKTDEGYDLEVSVPWETLSIEPTENMFIGLDIRVADDDDTNNREALYSWYNQAATEMKPELWGTALLGNTNYGPNNVKPIVEITSPLNNTVFQADEAINFTVLANDDDGVISRVNLVMNDLTIQSDTNSLDGWNFSVESVELGNHTFYASAVDDNGISGKSVQIDINVKEDTHIEKNEQPNQFRLEQNYPNPFNPLTVITYHVPQNAYVEMAVYNILGELVTKLVDGNQNAGSYSVIFNGKGLASGIYFCDLRVGELVARQKMMLLE